MTGSSLAFYVFYVYKYSTILKIVKHFSAKFRKILLFFHEVKSLCKLGQKLQNFTLTFRVFTYNINSTCKNFHLGFRRFFAGFLHQEGKKLMKNALVNLVNISKSFDNQMVLDDLNLYIREERVSDSVGPQWLRKDYNPPYLGRFQRPLIKVRSFSKAGISLTFHPISAI